MVAFADIVRSGKALYIGVSEWTADQLRQGAALARELRIPFVSNQPQYSALWRVIEAEVVPASRELGISQIVWSPVAQGVLTGKYLPGSGVPIGSRAADDKGGSEMIGRYLRDDVLAQSKGSDRLPTNCRSQWPSSPSPGCFRTTTWRPRSSGPRDLSRFARTRRPLG
jgi:aryl-alcohol dehydrogenase-like predicted oxidoreductase